MGLFGRPNCITISPLKFSTNPKPTAHHKRHKRPVAPTSSARSSSSNSAKARDLSMADKIFRGRTTLYSLTSSLRPNATVPKTTNRLFSSKPSPPNQSIYRKQIALANLLQRYGFSPSQLQSFLSRNHSLLNSNLQDIENSLGILLSFKIPQKSIVSLVTSCPGVLEVEFLKRWQIGFSKSGDLGASPFVIRSVLEHSRRFQIDPDGFSKSLNVLKGLGFSECTMRRVLEGFPRVIIMKGTEIKGKIQLFKEMGFCRDEVDWILNSFPEVLGFGIDSRLIPLLREFEDLGFGKELVRKEIVRDPRVLGMEVGELSRCLDLLRTLKCREPIKLKIFGDGEFRAGFEAKLRIDCLCEHGLIRREALKVLWKEPRVIVYRTHEIEKKIEFLVSTMGFNVGVLVDVPEYLGVSFEKQIVPRYNVIEYLRAKGGLGDEVGLKDMIKLSRRRFYNLYVKPYPDCEKFFGRFSGDVQVKSCHPTGLWKLFKPQRPLESEEDVKNIKSFMETLV
ncbi:hypothetical protein Tsubulata_017525 [Turnera subulata]|uniref:Uncharacterized protein n=1 Tax=Turnera subulata TaxID=218843 RepID=A0A9Q0J846_9ROSI|nr:hypothetical protein Tsubulata_017525 [Turnera subulata]